MCIIGFIQVILVEHNLYIDILYMFYTSNRSNFSFLFQAVYFYKQLQCSVYTGHITQIFFLKIICVIESSKLN